jgi:aryl-alcohol dehydrogenase-like predicted oxidoreductase
VQASLKRLGVERIDLYQIHRPPDSEDSTIESWGEMGKLVDEGLVGAIGLSNVSIDLLRRCHATRRVDSFQPPLSLIHREAMPDIAVAEGLGVGVIVYSPLATGLLTEQASLERIRTIRPPDRRLSHDDFKSPSVERNLALRDALRPIAKRQGTNVAAIAIAWALQCRGVNAAIVGARAVEQIEDALQAATIELSDRDLKAIAIALGAASL